MSATRNASPPMMYRLGFRIYRILQLLIGLAFFAGIFWGWRMINDPRQFPIASIKVQASYQHLDRQELSQIIMPFISRGMFHVNSNQLEEQLQTLPWIAKVEVHRVWPDTVIIKITEQQAIARWNDEQLLNEHGELFQPPVTSLPKDLPELQGAAGQIKNLWENYQSMNLALAPLKLKIVSLDASSRESYTLILNNGLKLLLGRNQPLPRLERFVKVYPRIFNDQDRPAESADLRYENGVSVKWQNIQPLVAASKNESSLLEE